MGANQAVFDLPLDMQKGNEGKLRRLLRKLREKYKQLMDKLSYQASIPWNGKMVSQQEMCSLMFGQIANQKEWLQGFFSVNVAQSFQTDGDTAVKMFFMTMSDVFQLWSDIYLLMKQYYDFVDSVQHLQHKIVELYSATHVF